MTAIDVDNRDARRRMARFRIELLMLGARILPSFDHGIIEIECPKGTQQTVRELAAKHGITLGSTS